MLTIISVIHSYFFSTDILLFKQPLFRTRRLRNFYSCSSYSVIQYVMNSVKQPTTQRPLCLGEIGKPIEIKVPVGNSKPAPRTAASKMEKSSKLRQG